MLQENELSCLADFGRSSQRLLGKRSNGAPVIHNAVAALAFNPREEMVIEGEALTKPASKAALDVLAHTDADQKLSSNSQRVVDSAEEVVLASLSVVASPPTTTLYH